MITPASVRTRFAPSPTGQLHVGSARTALYAYLYARHCNGTFILRIEDTDLSRSTQTSIDAILESLAWLGLSYDEGPFFQTQRFERYRKIAYQLLNEKKAYKCYCSFERLQSLREQQLKNKKKPRYDQHCLYNAPSSENKNGPFVIRFINPVDGEVCFQDAVHGETVFNNTELDDLIIIRSDGSPTYNFCVVIDDWDMAITHVIRGDDHLNNTPRQINLLKALGAYIPVYAHIPMILGSDGKRLSKRHGAVSVMQFREEGILPHALLNYLARLGWSYGDQEIFSLPELVKLFDLCHLNKSAASLNPQKLLWLNQHYLKHPDKNSWPLLKKEWDFHLKQQGIAAPETIQKELSFETLLETQGPRCKTLKEMVMRSRFFYEDPLYPDETLIKKHIPENLYPALNTLLQSLSTLDPWEQANIHDTFQAILTQYALKQSDFAQAVRIILTGSTVSPPLDSTLFILGREKTLFRLHRFITLSLAQSD